MKLGIVLFCACALMLGCNGTDSPSPSDAGSSAPPTASATASPSARSTSSPSPTATASPTATPAVNTHVADENLKRTFQLKDLKKIPLRVGKTHITVWIMDTDQKREEGMMYLGDREVKADEGMLFVFDRAQQLSFWMRNTVLPLDIMYVDADKRIINIAPGKPFDETPIPANRPGQYVIEMKQGSAKRLGIKAGDDVGIPADVKAQD